MTEQSGIYRAVLYENINVAYIRNASGEIESIVNSGKIIDIVGCESLFLNFEDVNTIGRNNMVIHDYTLSFTSFGFDKSVFFQDIASVFGFVPVIFFNNGAIKVVNSPLFFEDQVNYNEANTQSNQITLVNQSPTFRTYIDFADIAPVWILADGTWNDAGVWIDTEVWNDN